MSQPGRIRPPVPALLALALAAASVTPPAGAQEFRPEPWTPRAAPADTADAAPAGPRPFVPPPGVVRPLDLVFEPSTPDSSLPFVSEWELVPTREVLTTYVGTLRQDAPQRAFPIALPGQKVHADVDGGRDGTVLGVALMLPWIHRILTLPYCESVLVVRRDDGPEQKTKLLFGPGPNLFIPGQPPVPLSNPVLHLVNLPPGPHHLLLDLDDTPATYYFVQLARPRLSPLPILR